MWLVIAASAAAVTDAAVTVIVVVVCHLFRIAILGFRENICIVTIVANAKRKQTETRVKRRSGVGKIIMCNVWQALTISGTFVDSFVQADNNISFSVIFTCM